MKINLKNIKENKDKIKNIKEIYQILNDELLLDPIPKNFFNLILSSGDKDIKNEIDEFESQYKSFLFI